MGICVNIRVTNFVFTWRFLAGFGEKLQNGSAGWFSYKEAQGGTKSSTPWAPERSELQAHLTQYYHSLNFIANFWQVKTSRQISF
jgi:hypothetical protein